MSRTDAILLAVGALVLVVLAVILVRGAQPARIPVPPPSGPSTTDRTLSFLDSLFSFGSKAVDAYQSS